MTCTNVLCNTPKTVPQNHPPTLFLHGLIDPILFISRLMDHARAQAININNWPLQLGTSLQLMDARSIYLSTPPTTNGQQRAPNNTQHAKMYSRFLHAFTSLCTICLHVLHCFVRLYYFAQSRDEIDIYEENQTTRTSKKIKINK